MPVQFIPNSFGPKTPHSEKLVAKWLKEDVNASKFTVYHSHGLGAHEHVLNSNDFKKKKPHGEIDFVILVPPCGVVTVEVKGDQISRSDGRWRQRGTCYDKFINDPTAQMIGNQHEFLKNLKGRLSNNADRNNIRVAGLVIFPKTAQCPPAQDIECNPWEVVSFSEIQKYGISGCILRALKLTGDALGDSSRQMPPPGLMARIKSVIRRDFDLPVSSIVMREEEKQRRIELTQQQYQFLSVVDANGKALVSGSAGTGKTLLALEFAKREILDGRNVGLFCFNKLLGSWLERHADTLHGQLSQHNIGEITAGTFQSWMHKIVHKNNDLKTLFQQEVNRRGIKSRWEILNQCAALALQENKKKFDTLIIDEMQDFQDISWFPLLDSSLEGGWKDGRWSLFGDYSRQSIAVNANTIDEAGLEEDLRGFGAYPVKLPLNINCRNTKRIAEMTAALTKLEDKNYKIQGPDGERVDRGYFRNEKQQVEKIQEFYLKYLNEEFKPEEIVLLWDSSSGSSDFYKSAASLGMKLVDWGQNQISKGEIQSTSIQKFKGLEADAVIVCNIHAMSEASLQQKLYVAMTRARSRLALILHETLKERADKLIANYYLEQLNAK